MACGRRPLDLGGASSSGGHGGIEVTDGGAFGGGSGTAGAPDAGGGAVLKQIGTECAEGIDCESSFCANGVCCLSACDGACQSCILPGSVGTCVPSAVAGWLCGPARCEGNTLTSAPTCDGNGACVASAVEICAPFACDAQAAACSATCASDAECSNATCVNGVCRGIVGTGSCQRDDECTSGFCVDGVCCNVACQGACVSCAMPGHAGICEPVATGNRDPRAVCVDQGAASCGTTGKCDGFGACALYAGVLCAPVTCDGATLTPARYCDGSGACAAAHQTQSCAPLACRTDVAQCADNCPAGDTICMPGAYCSGNEVCAARKAPGVPCAGDHECTSMKCISDVDGGPSSCAGLI